MRRHYRVATTEHARRQRLTPRVRTPSRRSERHGDGSSGSTDAGSSGAADTGAGAVADGATPTPATCSAIPEETGGPYPGDGTNGPNTLTSTGIVRSDIRPSFAAMTGTAAGIPLTIKLTLVNVNAGCAALAGYAIYLWHCDRDGNYSLYTSVRNLSQISLASDNVFSDGATL